MAGLGWLDEHLASDDKETDAQWELLSTIHQQLRTAIATEAPVRGGSQVGRAPNIDRGFAEAHKGIWRDDFAPDSVYPPETFRRRFRMRRNLFARIHNAVLNHDVYFQERHDALGRPGLSCIQKITAALRIFAYGMAADSVDEYIRIVGWQGQYQDKNGNKSLVMEAVASRDLWIWHAFISVLGSLNDINVIDRSPLMVNYLRGVAPHAEFTINGHVYHMCYLLADGIYPDWTVFQKIISEPQGEKNGIPSARKEPAKILNMHLVSYKYNGECCTTWHGYGANRS